MKNTYKDEIIYNLNLLNTKLGDEFFYPSLPIVIIDAVFSIRLDYDKQVRPLIEKYKNAYGEKQTVSEFINVIKSIGIEKFADTVLSKNKTAGQNSILKAEAVYKWAKILQSKGIEKKEDFGRLGQNGIKELEKDFATIQGQGEAVIKYFFMLCGNENLCKPDRHILRFLSNLTGTTVCENEAQAIMDDLVKELRTDFPDMTVRKLDYIIWKYQKSLFK